MEEWLKRSDDQAAKLAPVVDTPIPKVDADLAKVDAAEEPDAMAFVQEYGEIKKEFDTGVMNGIGCSRRAGRCSLHAAGLMPMNTVRYVVPVRGHC